MITAADQVAHFWKSVDKSAGPRKEVSGMRQLLMILALVASAACEEESPETCPQGTTHVGFVKGPGSTWNKLCLLPGAKVEAP